jgi:hypothetical protein
MSDYEGRRIYQRNFIKEELSLLRQAVESEINFCNRQMRLLESTDDEKGEIRDKQYIRSSVIETYRKLITVYQLLSKKMQESYEE